MYFKIDPMYQKDEFRRKAWISFAKEDAPLDVFNSELSDVTQEQYRIISSTANYDTKWEGEIGYDRRESYLDVETYYEKIPYTDYERKYNYSTKQYEQVPVTKYRKEERQRQVTKYRTVTDWFSRHGNHSGTASCFEYVDTMDTFDFLRLLKDFDADFCKAMSTADLEKDSSMRLSDSIMDMASDHLKEKIDSNLRKSLPGDRSTDISYDITEYTVTHTSMIRVPEYHTTLTYNGQTYEKRGFAIGKMRISEANIPNPESVEEGKKKLEQKRDLEIKERERKASQTIDKKTLPFALISWGLLLASIAVSAFLRFLVPVVILFAAAVGMTIFARIQETVVRQKIKKITDTQNQKTRTACSDACRDYEKNKRAELLNALNKKLTSLGLKPATEAELLDN
ncbi:MAG: hypothetical protein E7637_07555 [Ruminococcaceae bacterium]|nr:hypothetical protein [Oscillospiraceae bacterium]